ncbi:unnamed protein product [Phytophthora lilii]|uniref:Unnamed protein product n=1 Tax=Phytophthora lilii TaxID=2077276 RepID=A0A9W6U3W1_9STRA|nr:unnamed protein product [Phytophthora lilii]
MRVANVLLVIVLALLANFAKAHPTKISRVSSYDSPTYQTDREKSLRVAATIESDSTSSEDRGGLQSLVAWARTNYWIETGKTDEYVKKALGLENVSGAALKSAPNYFYYEHFRQTIEWRKLDAWLRNKIPSQLVWKKLNLKDIPAAERVDNDDYKMFVRYVKMEDDNFFYYKNNDIDIKIKYGGSPEEMAIKLDVWVEAKRPNWYVQKMLNLDFRSRNALRKSEYYPYYQEFLKMTGQLKELPKKPLVLSIEN